MPALKTPTLECDRRILMIVVILMAVGASLVASSSSYFSEAKFGDPYFLLKRHLVRLVLAGFFLVFASRIDYRCFRKLSPVVFAFGVVLLLGLFVSGHTIRNTVRWYQIGFLQITLQPAEIARLALVFFVAFWVARKGKEIEDFKRGFLPIAAAVVTVLALMAAQPNYGSATATVIIAFLMLYLGGARVAHLAALGGTLIVTALVRILSVDYVRERIFAFVNPADGVTAMNWQRFQSIVALGSGGVFGAGFGASRQKLNWLPDSHTDFIFSILGEEVGLAGTMFVSLLFLLFALRALKLSRSSGDKFGEMLAAGIGCSIFVYAFLNMAVATGLFPVTGLPLPFLSYGGSALVVNAFSVGLLLNVSRKQWGKVAGNSRRSLT